MISLRMRPETGARLVRYVGDTVVFTLEEASGRALPPAWRGMVRTNLGRSRALHRTILGAAAGPQPTAGAEWRDLPMRRQDHAWTLELPLTEPGFFAAKAFAVDERGWQHWTIGPDTGLCVHPDGARTSNLIYCAFPRMFGPSRTRATTGDPALEGRLAELDAQGFTVIPPSGKLRDLQQHLPHIFDTLGCRILHLLPVSPTPTTGARYGRFGSPYAALDLTAIDPALVDFDRRTTGIQQFEELAQAVHQRGGRLFLDLVINHTGWGSSLQENHPEWFRRLPNGEFASPGAWGNTWMDLVELEPHHFELWHELGDVFLTWCRRGVDGFRCDAGYKVPMPVWRYLTARVREEFPDTIFLLEGLGGAWQDTETLLTEGGMQWAYSELFQEFSPLQVSGYLDHALLQSTRVGTLIHYSETHDNDRLAARSPAWSLLRNRLAALTSVSGGFGFTCGVEWLAQEKINVHSARGLAWDNPHHLLDELARLNHLLAQHPCFFDHARLTRLSEPSDPVYALLRQAANQQDVALVLVNTDPAAPHEASLPQETLAHLPHPPVLEWVDLLGQPSPAHHARGRLLFHLVPGAAYCLAPQPTPIGLAGDAYRQTRALAAWALRALTAILDPAAIGAFDWQALAALAQRNPAAFLGSLHRLDPHQTRDRIVAALTEATSQNAYAPVITWQSPDQSRITLIPFHHWLLIQDEAPFRARLTSPHGVVTRLASIPSSQGHIASLPPNSLHGTCQLELDRYAQDTRSIAATVRFLTAEPSFPAHFEGPAYPDLPSPPPTPSQPAPAISGQELIRAAHQRTTRAPALQRLRDALVLLTNRRGAMARIMVDLGRVHSKYDCVLAANLHPEVPVDRHVLIKRIRLWANADGFIGPLEALGLRRFTPGPPARWDLVANAGDGRAVGIALTTWMVPDENTIAFRLERVPLPAGGPWTELPTPFEVRLTVRLDLEDRNFHWETKRNSGADHHFRSHLKPLNTPPGFDFQPAHDRALRAWSDHGQFHESPEWSDHLPHPIEATRGMTGEGDAFSPGWWDLPLSPSQPVTLVASAEPQRHPTQPVPLPPQPSNPPPHHPSFASTLHHAAADFVVRRGEGRTVIAGYPWFLDWGRDTLICARGLLAAGHHDEVRRILLTFARFEDRGTLPNAIHGENASNRDTSDAPLWFGIACEDLAQTSTPPHPPLSLTSDPFSAVVDARGRTLADVLRSIAAGYLAGTPNGVTVDPASGLVWSPSHFTWMDTNHPAGTPREGYPIEIQILWIRLLRLLARLQAAPVAEPWDLLAERAAASLHELFWLESKGWLADVLLAPRGQTARQARPDHALRPNMLFAVSLGELTGPRAQQCVAAAARYLVVPGALRSLAPLPVDPPLPIHAADGRLLNDPTRPYAGRYEGDEDTRRKPAYHNGTAWVWLLPTFCEALVHAWGANPTTLAAARSYLGSTEHLLTQGCLGQLPEILDGDAPHQERGCDAQAWSITETLRVWRWLDQPQPLPPPA